MTVTTNEFGQNNLFAKEPPMVVEDYNRKGLFSPMQYREMYNGRWAMMGIVSGLLSYAITGRLFFGIFWYLMSNENALWEDMRKLNDLYEELLWHPDDELQFTHDGERIIIINTTLENKQWNLVSHPKQKSLTQEQQWLVLLQA